MKMNRQLIANYILFPIYKKRQKRFLIKITLLHRHIKILNLIHFTLSLSVLLLSVETAICVTISFSLLISLNGIRLVFLYFPFFFIFLLSFFWGLCDSAFYFPD